DPLRTFQALPDRRLADPAAAGDPASAQTTLREESQNLSYLPHADSPCWHRGPLLKGTQDARATQPPRVVDAVSRTDSDPRRPPVPGDPDHPFRRTGKSGHLQAGTGGRLPAESVAPFASESLAAFARKTHPWDAERPPGPGPGGGGPTSYLLSSWPQWSQSRIPPPERNPSI